MTWKGFLGCWMLLAVVAGAQIFTRTEVLDHTKVWEGPCTYKNWKLADEGEKIHLILNCNDQEAYTTQTNIIVAARDNLAPFFCKLFKTGRAECQLVQ